MAFIDSEAKVFRGSTSNNLKGVYNELISINMNVNLEVSV
jgi:hypothetical protein